MSELQSGRRCRFAKECHVYKGQVELKQALFIVRNMYCNNSYRGWNRCQVHEQFNTGEPVDATMLPTNDLRKE